LDAGDAYGRTPLHCAVAGNHANATRVLLTAGCDAGCVDVHGHTPEAIAAGTEALIKASADGAHGSAAGAASGSRGWSHCRHYATGELPRHEPATRCLPLLRDPALVFWNASVRAGRCYSEKRYAAAIIAYSAAIAAAPAAVSTATPSACARACPWIVPANTIGSAFSVLAACVC